MRLPTRWLVFGMLLTPGWAWAEEVSIVKTEKTIEFSIGSSVVTRYHIAPSVAKPYFWPLLAKGDIPVTRAWPMEDNSKDTKDHVHQKSAWFCHGDVLPVGMEMKVRSKDKRVKGVDFWSEVEGHGKMVCVSVAEPKGNSIATKNEWRTADHVKILDEERTITLKALGDARLLILDIHLQASVCPIVFEDTKEGSMGIRVHDSLAVKQGTGDLRNAEGKLLSKKKDEGVWGFPSPWNDYSGTVLDQKVGIALLEDPDNKFKSAWHSRDYGLMSANPFGRSGAGFPSQKGKTDLVRLEKGDHLKLRYGILIHLGDAKTGNVAEHYQTFLKK